MRFIKFLFLTAFISVSFELNAMPPHPDAVDQSLKDGQLKSLMNRVESINNKQNMNSPQKTFPSSGQRRLPVLLVNYASSYQASVDFSLFFTDLKKGNMLFYSLFLLSISVLSFAIRKTAISNNALPKPLVPVCLILFVFTVSCGVEDEKKEIVFATDPSVYSGILNGDELSVRRYYQDMSNNTLNLTFDIYGPVKVSKSWDYYGKNVSDNDSHPGELASEAIRLMVSKYSSANFSVYDNDSDGSVDAVIIIHEGPGEEVKASITGLIWSHQWDLHSANSSGDGEGPVYTDGVFFNVYTMQPEYTNDRGDSSMGVFAHEFGHVLGLPDLYDTTNQTYGVGNWSLMASGAWKGPGVLNDGTTPSPLLAWERFKLGGSSWLTVTELTTAGTQLIENVETSHVVYKLVLDPASGQEQYLLVEGKNASTPVQWYVAGSGILISHIHEGVISYFTGSNTVNAGDNRIHGVNIVEADGNSNLWNKTISADSGDLYIPLKSITIAKKYNDLAYSLSTEDTSVSITNIKSTPWSFDYTP